MYLNVIMTLILLVLVAMFNVFDTIKDILNDLKKDNSHERIYSDKERSDHLS